MFKELIDAIQTGVKGEPVTIDGKEFSTAPVYDAPEPRIAAALTTATLQSLVDYLKEDIDAVTSAKAFLHVHDPVTVSVELYLDSTNRREQRVRAEFEPHNFGFGKQYDQAEFITLLRSQFAQTDEREALQRFVGSLTDDSSLKLEDDGVSQKTVAKTGITTFERIENKDAIMLAPHRTFPEIEQPESEFILRLHRREGSVPMISLHEADNQAWKIEAINRIAEWLKKQGVEIPILA